MPVSTPASDGSRREYRPLRPSAAGQPLPRPVDCDAAFRHLVEHSLAGIHVIQDGVYVYVNPKLAEIFGYTVDEMLALQQWQKLVAPEDREIVSGHVRQRESGDVASARCMFRGLRK